MNKSIFNYKIIRDVLLIVSVVLLSVFFYFLLANHLLFHVSMSIAIVIVSVIAAMIGIMTEYKLKSNLQSRLSPPLLFFAIMIFIHTLNYPGMNIFPGDGVYRSLYIKILADLLLAAGICAAVMDHKGKVSPLVRFGLTLVVSVSILLLVFLNILPPLSIDGVATVARTIFDFFIIVLLLAALLFLLFKKFHVSSAIHKTITVSLILLILSEVLFAIHDVSGDTIFFLSLAFMYVSLVMILYLVVRYNLLMPYNDLMETLRTEKDSEIALREEISDSYDRLAESQSIGHVGSWELNLTNMTIWASDEAFRIYGHPITPDNHLSLIKVQSFVIEDDRMMLDQALHDLIKYQRPYDVTFTIRNNLDEYHHIHSVARLQKNEQGDPIKVIGVLHDITQLKAEQDKLLYASIHDHLTGVYNRRYFSDQRESLNQRRYLPLSIVILDINGLKIINDSFGHHIGNEVLSVFAQTVNDRLKSKKHFVARIGGDEFAIVMPNTSYENAEILVPDLLKHLEKVRVGNIIISAAYGIATRDHLDTHLDITLKKAEDEMYLYKISDSQSAKNKIIDALLTTLNEKDVYSEEHSQRVSDYAFLLAKACNLSNKKINDIKVAGLLHDIGKITISNEILNKKGKLTKEEYDIIKTHSEKGYRILHSIGDMDIIANYVLQHHEYIDGKGYPKGLTGDDLTLEAKIIAIADAYDAMTSYREYKRRMDMSEAIAELQRCKGTQFDPDLVDIFIENVLNKMSMSE